MAVPKQLAKRIRLERKRLRKRETRLARRGLGAPRLSYSSDFSPATQVVHGPVGGFKMSDVLSEFIAPLMDSTNNRSDLTQLLSMAQTAWNIALEPADCHEAMIDEAIAERLINPSKRLRVGCRELLGWFVARKLKHFADCRRLILGFEVKDLEDGGHYLSVASGVLY
jgi:hypothetical protein